MSNTIFCEEMLDNIKKSLNYCINNKQTYQFKVENNININSLPPFFLASKCPNIIYFHKYLVETNTKIIYNTPKIDIKQCYSIEYDVSKRQIIIDQ